MSWVLAFLGFCALIVLHEAGHFAAAKAVGMRVEKFMLFFGRPLFSTRRGETQYGVGWIPAGGFVKITGMDPREELPPQIAARAYYKQPVWKRIVVISAGPLVNIVLALAILATLFLVEGKPSDTRFVAAGIEQGSPAERVLRDGDVIVAADGKRGDPSVIAKQIRSHTCDGRPTPNCQATTPVALTIERDGREQTVSAVPRYDAELKRTRLGFGFERALEPVGVGEAARLSVTGSWNVTKATVEALGKLFYDEEARKEVSGVVGSYEVTRQSFELDFQRAMQVLALISLSLAIINLFPFLPLDGGHIFWAIAEKLRGRPIPFSVLERVSVVGFVLVAMIFLLGLTNDINRLSGEGFDVR